MSLFRIAAWVLGVVALASCLPASPDGPGAAAEVDVTVSSRQVRIRQHRRWLAVDRGTTPWPLRVFPYHIEDVRLVAREPFDDLMRELHEEATEPFIHLDVADDVPALHVELLRSALWTSDWRQLRMRLAWNDRQAYVEVPGLLMCACAADEPYRSCVQPTVELWPQGAVVKLWPALQGPCRTAKAKSRLYSSEELRALDPDNLPRNPPRADGPIKVVTRIVVQPLQCTSVLREQGTLDLHALARMLMRGVLLDPGCPYATVAAGSNISWGELKAVLGFIALDRGWEPALYVDPALDHPLARTQCTDTLLESALPELPTEAPMKSLARPGCPRSDDDR